MINIRELRIGNYVIWGGREKPAIVNGVFIRKSPAKTENVLLLDKEYIETFEDNIQPVPLTTEMLLKCGFYEEKKNKTYIKEIDGYIGYARLKFYAYIKADNTVDSIRVRQGQNHTGNTLNIISIHQLQNLYFALTGQELELKF